jgi:glycosyltransferase involved in cell wall biosynthesis
LQHVAGVVHDGAFIEKWLGVRPDICPDQGLSPTADELIPVPEPPPTSAIYIGRLEPDTGIAIYIDAVRLLTGRGGRPLTLDVYGDGSLGASLRATVEREGLPVRFHGRIADAQNRITDSCFAFIDGRMAIQEAMARRRLVLAAYLNPLKRDYLSGERFSPHLVAVGTADELASRTAHFIDHPDRRAAIIERAFAHTQTLTWSRTAAAYLTLWREKLGAPSQLPARRVTLRPSPAGLHASFSPTSESAITEPRP